MPDSLPPSEQRKLVGILGRLGSDHSGEVVAAAHLASTMLRRHGLTWEALLAPAPLAPTGEPDDWRTLVAPCLQFPGLMTEWERKFLGDVRLSRRPTPRQIEKVHQIAEQLRERRAP
jgi:hypothetical protein